MNKNAITFSDMLLKLQQYWADQGCNIVQPYDIPSGAGTFHPATLLKSLDSKPWSAAYVAPCRRPTDGRYGENPNRLGSYYQFQAPSVGDSQLSSTNLMSCSCKLSPKYSNDFK